MIQWVILSCATCVPPPSFDLLTLPCLQPPGVPHQPQLRQQSDRSLSEQHERLVQRVANRSHVDYLGTELAGMRVHPGAGSTGEGSD
jgi:hypothetical protein